MMFFIITLGRRAGAVPIETSCNHGIILLQYQSLIAKNRTLPPTIKPHIAGPPSRATFSRMENV
jgi:hypothetical protein